MTMSYNLRSLKRKKGISVGKCYLQNTLEDRSPETFNPKVRLEKLKLLECCDNQNSRFYLKKGRITLKQNKSFSISKRIKKNVLKILCTILLLASSVYCTDLFQSFDLGFAKQYVHSAVQNLYFDAIKSQANFWKKIDNQDQKTHIEDKKSDPATSEEKLTLVHDSFEIRNLVRDYFIEINKKNKFHNIIQSTKSFIEEQCEVNLKENANPGQNNFYNGTVFDLASFTDYALESQGAKIVTVFDTELYGTIAVKFLNFNLLPEVVQFLLKYSSGLIFNGPSSVLVPWKNPGDCWAFKGNHGRIQIELSEKIFITAITIDHIPKNIAPNGSIQSAPKEFSIIGIEESGEQVSKIYLGDYEYKSSGPSTQTFFLQQKMNVPIGKVEVIISSNHGNENYTCIYKIRVHGHK